MKNKNIFKDRLKELRKENYFTQEDLSNKLKIVRTAITNYESGRTIPDSETLIEISKVFNVSLDYLVGNSDIKNSSIFIDSTEKTNSLSDQIIKLLVDTGQLSEEDLLNNNVPQEEIDKILDKIDKAIKISEIYKEK